MPARWNCNVHLGLYTSAAWLVRLIKQVMVSLKNSDMEPIRVITAFHTHFSKSCKIATGNRRMDAGGVSGRFLDLLKELSLKTFG